AMKNSGVGPNSTHARANNAAVTASTIGYRHGMGAAHARHRPRSSANESRGMLSYHVIGAPQPGHAERGAHRLRRSGRRAITTLRKLPSIRPKTTTTASSISEMVVGHDVARRRWMKQAQNHELPAHLRRVSGFLVGSHEDDARSLGEWLLARSTQQLGDPLVEPTQPNKRGTEIRPRDGIVFGQRDGPAQVGQSFAELVLLIQRITEVVERIHFVWLDVEGPSQSGFRVAYAAEMKQRQSQAPVWLGTIRPEYQRLFEMVDSGRELAGS